MRNNPEIKLVVGILIWVGAIASIVIGVRQSNSISPQAVEKLVHYVGAQRSSVDLVSPYHVVIGIGDPLFIEIDGVLEPVGMVTALEQDTPKSPQTQSAHTQSAHTQSTPTKSKRKPARIAWVKRATVTFFSGSPPIGGDATVELNETNQSPAWVVKTMFSPAMRDEISQLILTAYKDHQEDLVEQFRPVIKKTIVDSARLIRDGVVHELEQRQDSVNAIAKRYQRDVIERELLPVIQAEVWPIIEEEASPLVEEIGQEIWQEVSVWRFGWRFLYDQSPLPDKKLSQREFDRFVQNKAIPIFETHFEDVVEIQQRMIARVLANRKVTEKVSSVARQFFSDQEVQKLFQDVFQKAVVDNTDLRQSIEETWRSTEARCAMKIANSRLESTITSIGQALFGSPNGKITDEFARVLRNRVLHKDDRWLVLKPSTAAQQNTSSEPVRELALTFAMDDAEFPIGFTKRSSKLKSTDRSGEPNRRDGVTKGDGTTAGDGETRGDDE